MLVVMWLDHDKLFQANHRAIKATRLRIAGMERALMRTEQVPPRPAEALAEPQMLEPGLT